MTLLKLTQDFVQSLPGQFMIGGLTVAGISYFGDNSTYPALAGVIAAVPIGMPSSVFVADKKVAAYSWNLLMMSIVLIFTTFTNWYYISELKWSKYRSVLVSLATFIVLAALYTLLKSS